MFKYVPSTWSTPAYCVFDEYHYLIKWNSKTHICFLDKNTRKIIKVGVPNPRNVRISYCETLNNIYMYIGDYFTIAFRRRTKTFDLIGSKECIG